MIRNLLLDSNMPSVLFQMKEEQKQQEEAAVFKARPNTVANKEPFQPRKESRVPVGKTTVGNHRASQGCAYRSTSFRFSISESAS